MAVGCWPWCWALEDVFINLTGHEFVDEPAPAEDARHAGRGSNAMAIETAAVTRPAGMRIARRTFVAGVILSRVIIAFAVTVITYAGGVYVFGADLSGNVLGLVGLATMGSLVFIGLGILMVSIARSEDDMPPMFILILMPSMLFSGAFLDRGGLPDWLHWITNGLPLTFLTNSVQEVANLGGGFTEIRGDLLGLAIWGLVATVLSGWRFKMA